MDDILDSVDTKGEAKKLTSGVDSSGDRRIQSKRMAIE
jgi:hypothetical protein